MGIDTHRHIGPYLKIRVPLEDVQVELPGECCKQICKSAFCPKCGKDVAKHMALHKREAISRGDVSRLIQESMRPLRDCCGQVEDGFHYWMNNGPGALDTDESGAQPLTFRDIDSAMHSFRVKFAADIETIEKAYGCQGEVIFGLLVWAS